MPNDLSTRIRPAFPACLLDVRPERLLRRSGGRETFAWDLGKESGAGSRTVVVKRTLGADLGSTWLGSMGGGTRPGGRREYEILEALRADGVPVPRAITWCEEREGFLARGARSLVVMEHVEHRETLRERLTHAGAAERRIWSAALVEVVARLHGLGWHHRDLYLQHFLIPEPAGPGRPGLVLIDVGRARRERSPRKRWLVKDLAALLVSCPDAVGARERLRFLARYLDARGIEDREGRRWWAEAVLAKAGRIAAHVPRDERGAC